jgi:hypothetical protein
MVEFADFNDGPKGAPMTDTNIPLIARLQKHGRAMRSRVISCAR